MTLWAMTNMQHSPYAADDLCMLLRTCPYQDECLTLTIVMKHLLTRIVCYSNLRVVTEVAKSLEFSSKIHQLADRVIHGMTKGGMEEYNAVHLRIERDARDWSQIMGGEAVHLLPCPCPTCETMQPHLLVIW